MQDESVHIEDQAPVYSELDRWIRGRRVYVVFVRRLRGGVNKESVSLEFWLLLRSWITWTQLVTMTYGSMEASLGDLANCSYSVLEEQKTPCSGMKRWRNGNSKYRRRVVTMGWHRVGEIQENVCRLTGMICWQREVNDSEGRRGNGGTKALDRKQDPNRDG